MRIATAEQMRTLDRRAIEERGVPSLELMERAANALAEAAIDTAANAPGRAVCFCGPGNNGGDGVACAACCWRRASRCAASWWGSGRS